MNFEEFVKEKRAIANKNNHVIFVEAVKERLRWAMKKIENVIERNDIPMTVEELCEEIESGKSSISYLLMKSFSKQNFYEKNRHRRRGREGSALARRDFRTGGPWTRRRTG